MPVSADVDHDGHRGTVTCTTQGTGGQFGECFITWQQYRGGSFEPRMWLNGAYAAETIRLTWHEGPDTNGAKVYEVTCRNARGAPGGDGLGNVVPMAIPLTVGPGTMAACEHYYNADQERRAVAYTLGTQTLHVEAWGVSCMNYPCSASGQLRFS